MPIYISLLSFTQKGAEHIKNSPARLDVAKKLFHVLVAELKQWYFVMSQFDAGVIAEVPDDETVAKLAMVIGVQGSIGTETFRYLRRINSER